MVIAGLVLVGVGRKQVFQQKGKKINWGSFLFGQGLMLVEMISPFVQSGELAEVVSGEKASQEKVKG